MASIPLRLAASLLLLAATTGTPTMAALQRDPIKGPMTICFKYSIFHLNADEKIDDWTLGIHDMSVRVVGPNGWSHTLRETEYRGVDEASLKLVSAKGNARRYQLGEVGRYVIFARWDPSDPKAKPLLFGSGPPDDNNDDAFYSRLEVVDPDTVRCGHSFLYGLFFENDFKPN